MRGTRGETQGDAGGRAGEEGATGGGWTCWGRRGRGGYARGARGRGGAGDARGEGGTGGLAGDARGARGARGEAEVDPAPDNVRGQVSTLGNAGSRRALQGDYSLGDIYNPYSVQMRRDVGRAIAHRGGYGPPRVPPSTTRPPPSRPVSGRVRPPNSPRTARD